jgi:hypothetical protein
MESTAQQAVGSIAVSFVFLAINVLVLLGILALNRRQGPPDTKPYPYVQKEHVLPPSDILGWEFDYARVTASEAMSERHTMVNFYLLIAGIVTTGVVAILGKDTGLPKAVGAVMLWLLCCIGWIYFLAIIRLRQAWHDSAKTMNRIKTFYIEHAQELACTELQSAFRWQPNTLPEPEKLWTVYFYSAMLISFLNSAAFVAGGAVLALSGPAVALLLTLLALIPYGLAFFAFHVWLYVAFLRRKTDTAEKGGDKGANSDAA